MIAGFNDSQRFFFFFENFRILRKNSVKFLGETFEEISERILGEADFPKECLEEFLENGLSYGFLEESFKEHVVRFVDVIEGIFLKKKNECNLQ